VAHEDISVEELKQRMDAGEQPFVIDVREENEFAQSRIPGTILMPMSRFGDIYTDLNDKKDAEIIVQCRSGARSDRVAGFLRNQGFSNVRNLAGGILAWHELNGR
jgi:rhodanese-related sulfurtransferase